jgi:FG-GAP-like repeat
VAYTNRSANEVVVNGAAPLNGLPYWTNPPYVARLTAGISQPVHVATGDVNRDSQPDVLVANAGSNSLTLYLNLGSTRFGSQVSYPLSAAPRQVALEDLNGAGYPEMIAITADGLTSKRVLLQ